MDWRFVGKDRYDDGVVKVCFKYVNEEVQSWVIRVRSDGVGSFRGSVFIEVALCWKEQLEFFSSYWNLIIYSSVGVVCGRERRLIFQKLVVCVDSMLFYFLVLLRLRFFYFGSSWSVLGKVVRRQCFKSLGCMFSWWLCFEVRVQVFVLESVFFVVVFFFSVNYGEI